MADNADRSPAQQNADAAFELVQGDAACGVVLLCDHASNALPPDYGNLGLPESEFRRHIAYDIGAAELTRLLAARLGAPAVLSRFSRLLIDLNRGEDDPTLIMRLSDGVVVPGNAHIDSAERLKRIDRYYRPYHAAITRTLDAATSGGRAPAIISIHSFTPAWKGKPRPWQVAVLWDLDPRVAVPMIDALRAAGHLTVGDNEPYVGALKNDTLYRHASMRGLAPALIEVRQDLIAGSEGIAEWMGLLLPIITRLKDDPSVFVPRDYGSRSHGNT